MNGGKLDIPADFEYDLSYEELLDKICQLQMLAEKKLIEERPQIVQRLNETIRLYRITCNDLTFNQSVIIKTTKQKRKQ